MDEQPLIEESRIFPYTQRALFLDCVIEFKRLYEGEFVEVIKQAVHYFEPPKEIADVSIPLQELYDYLNHPLGRFRDKSPDDLSIPERLLPVLKRAIMSFRRARALNIENFKERTHNPDLLTRLEMELRPLNELIDQSWFKETI